MFCVSPKQNLLNPSLEPESFSSIKVITSLVLDLTFWLKKLIVLYLWDVIYMKTEYKLNANMLFKMRCMTALQ